MKIPIPRIKTTFWEKEIKPFQEATIGLMWTIIFIFAINTIINITTKMTKTAIINLLGITLISLIIMSYYKHKRNNKK